MQLIHPLPEKPNLSAGAVPSHSAEGIAYPPEPHEGTWGPGDAGGTEGKGRYDGLFQS